jgi:hypothetical protein
MLYRRIQERRPAGGSCSSLAGSTQEKGDYLIEAMRSRPDTRVASSEMAWLSRRVSRGSAGRACRSRAPVRAGHVLRAGLGSSIPIYTRLGSTQRCARSNGIRQTGCRDSCGVVVDDSINGVLVLPADADSLVSGINGLLRSPDARVRIGAAARETAKLYTCGALLPRLEAILAESADSRRYRVNGVR